MTETYYNLVNESLRAVGEVEIPLADFTSAVGFPQKRMKDAVNASIRYIDRKEYKWPWNAAQTTQVLVAGTVEYTYPADTKSVDWNSFELVRDDTLNVDSQPLREITLDEYMKYYRSRDFNSNSTDYDAPNYVYRNYSDTGFGVTPIPDQAYSIRYNYWAYHPVLTAATDQMLLPFSFKDAVIDGALLQYGYFKDNLEEKNQRQQDLDDTISRMRSMRVNRYTRVTETSRKKSSSQNRITFD